MDANILNHIDMLRLVLLILKRPDAAALILNIPALKAAYLKFVADMDEIEDVSIKLSSVTEGVTEAKTLVREILENKTLVISRVLTAHAHSINDVSLLKDVHYAKSSLEDLRDNELLSKSQFIYQKGTLNTGIFVNYGFLADPLPDLQTAIDNFEAKDKEPQEAIEVQKTLNAKADEIVFKACDLLKWEIDNMMLVVPPENAELVTTYLNGRNIIDRHGKFRKEAPVNGFGSLFGKITNSFDNEPIENAQITIVGTEFITTTDEDGDFLFDKVPVGKYEIEIVAVTYLTKRINDVEIDDDIDTEQSTGLDAEV
jgi:hypothetical protein